MSQHRDVGSTRRGSQQVANVAMSQRRDASTSRRLNVTTPQRRVVSTSRRLNVASSQRRDVSAIFASPSLKAKGTRNRGSFKNVRTRARKSEQLRPRLAEKRPTFVFFFSFMIKLRMFYRLITCVITSSMF